VLRVGVLMGGRIIEERILRKHESVSVGQSARSTFIIAHPSLPAHHVLFEVRKGEYVLHAESFMEGRLTTPDGPLNLERERLRIVLDDASRGRITFGDVTLLFQFMVPPPVQPRPQLPSSVRGAWLGQAVALFKAEEGFIGLTWSMSLTACLVLVVFFHVHDWPAQARSFDLDDRWFPIVTQPLEDPIEGQAADRKNDDGPGKKASETETDASPPAPESAPRKGPRKAMSEEEKAARDAKRKALVEEAMKYGLVGVIGSHGGSQKSGPLEDLLKTSSMASDIDKVMETVTGLKSAGPGDAWSKLEHPASSQGDEIAELDAMRDAQAADAELSTKDAVENSPKGRIKQGTLEERPSTGILDEKAVIATVRKGLPAIRNCYQKALKKNPTLQGKISVEFTIGPSGRVTAVKATDDSLGDASVTACVLGKFKSLKFDKPAGGSVKFVYPLMFKPGS
jgi:outer membrane biosynthesis protein TonB